ncbi:MAG: hydantoinase/oxoprolinase family protein [Alphaproteobacteria bacterium]
MPRYLIAVDVGGTFTDYVCYDRDSGTVEAWKTPSTPQDPTDGLIRGLRQVADPAAIETIRLGTTIATNAILERKGAEIAFLATAGFRDTPFIQRGNRRDHYDITWIKPEPLVSRRHCHDIPERIDRDGREVSPLDEDAVRAVARRLREEGAVQAVAVSYLFSFLDPAHERRTAEILAEELPGVPVSISYDVLPRWKEYERASTTIADAYLKPKVAPYLSRMRARVREAAPNARISVIKSNGGEMTVEAAAGAPIHMTVSGPSGGVIGAAMLARQIDRPNMVTLDMGGTSTDCSTIVGFDQSFTTSFEIEWGLPIQVPMIDIRTIGAGGGSIAWVDKGGMLRVGPQSAGADPGPACYGTGDLPTVTDANLLLGRIDPGNFLGGAMKLDPARARTAVAGVAAKIGYTPENCALAIVQIANTNMVGALRAVLLERGHDPRDFTLCAFGGAGPLHVGALMAEAGIDHGLVPNHPGQFSAYGFTTADARVDRHRTVQTTSAAFDPAAAQAVMQELIDDGVAELRQQGHAGELEIQAAVDMRYFGQNYELEVPLPAGGLRDTAALWQAFHAGHKARYGFAMPGSLIEVTTFVVTVIGRTEKPAAPSLAAATGPAEPVGRRPVTFHDGTHDTAVFDRAGLRAGHVIEGPALIEEAASVTVLPADQRCRVDGFGNLHLAFKEGPQ